MTTTEQPGDGTPSSPAAEPAPSTASSAAPAAGSGRVRASDAERETTVARLYQALGEGRLDLEEVETRVAAVYAARHRDELPAFLTDLPSAHHPAAETPTWDALWSGLLARLRLTVTERHTAGEPTTGRRLGLVAVLVVMWLLAWALLGATLA
jgi:hypothetical protein